MLEYFFNEVEDFQACNSIKKRLQHRSFPVNIAKFLRTAFFIEHLHGCFYKCSVKKLFRKVLQISSEHIAIGALFYQVAGL